MESVQKVQIVLVNRLILARLVLVALEPQKASTQRILKSSMNSNPSVHRAQAVLAVTLMT